MSRIYQKIKKLKGLIIYIIILVIGVYLYYKSEIFKDFVMIILVSYILAYVLRPAHQLLQRRKINKKISALILLLVIAGFFILLIIYFIPNLFRESLNIQEIILEGQSIINGIMRRINLNNLNVINFSTDSLYERINGIILGFSQNIINSLLTIGEKLLGLAIIPVVTYYLLSDGELISKKLLLFLPTKDRQIFRKVAADIDRLLSRYIVSQLILCLIIGVLTFIALTMLKIDFPVWLSLFNAILNIIPYFGPIFGAVPAIFIALMQSGEKALWTALVLFIIQQLEGDILSPKILGDSISIHPVLIIILLLLGQKLSGFVGMLLVVPFAVIIKVIYEDINYHIF